MPSKLVTDRQKSAEAVAAVGESQADAVADVLTERLQDYLVQGETMPDIGLFLKLLARALNAAKDGMVAADEAHRAELDDDQKSRSDRDVATEELRDRVVDVRELLIGLYGQKAAAKVAKGATPRDPVVLSRFASEIADSLSKATLPRPRIPGAALTMAEVVADLQARRQAADHSLRAMARDLRESEAALNAKNKAIEHYDSTFSAIARVYEGLLAAVDLHELAEKVRPSNKRPGRIEQEPTEEPTEDDPDAT